MLQGRQRGAALLLVVWVVALLSLLAATALQITTASGHAAVAGLERARMEAAADGATNLALLQLIDRDSESTIAPGVGTTVEVGGYKVAVTVQDEAGKLDVNRVSADVLKRISRSYGLSEQDSTSWSKAITGFRSDGNKPALEFTGVVPNRVFRSVDELTLIAATPEKIFNCLRQDLTVYNGLDSPDRRYMSAGAKRAFEPTLAPPPNSPATVDSDSASSYAGRVLSINASLQNAQSAFVRHMVARVTGDPARPVLVAVSNVDTLSSSAERDCRSAEPMR